MVMTDDDVDYNGNGSDGYADYNGDGSNGDGRLQW